MPQRLSAVDASLLYLEDASTPMHVGSVAVFQRPEQGFDFPALLALVDKRLRFLPRYRQRVVPVPANLARPVWVDDIDFDINYHVRRSALPDPGSDEQLFDLAARLLARPLDQGRPLWEVYVIEGLADDRIALVTKTHQTLVDGIGTIELGQLILDDDPSAADDAEEDGAWVPAKPPSVTDLVLDAVGDTIRRPTMLADSARAVAGDAAATAAKLGDAVGGVTSTLREMIAPAASGPLTAPESGGRVVAGVRSTLDDYRAIRDTHGGSVNDVVLAVIAGALRGWLIARGCAPEPDSTVRALLPVAVTDASTRGYSSAGLVGNEVQAYLVDLPVGEPDPVRRLQHIGYAMSQHVDSGRSVAARTLATVGGFAPPTLHSLGARAAGTLSHRLFQLVITNSPGPQVPMYAGSARLVEMFPIMPLVRQHALAIGVTSYHGGVYFGLNGDRKAVCDIDVVATQLTVALDELKGETR